MTKQMRFECALQLSECNVRLTARLADFHTWGPAAVNVNEASPIRVLVHCSRHVCLTNAVVGALQGNQIFSLVQFYFNTNRQTTVSRTITEWKSTIQWGKSLAGSLFSDRWTARECAKVNNMSGQLYIETSWPAVYRGLPFTAYLHDDFTHLNDALSVRTVCLLLCV